MTIRRRDFLKGALITGGAALTGSVAAKGAGKLFAGTLRDEVAPLPPPDQSGIEHVVVIMMENRSFDHFLGWLPGANGRQAGLQYRDPSGKLHSTYRLAPD